jgi:phospholipid/cholesterol/gamma-HCH transport system substrate-binding protein
MRKQFETEIKVGIFVSVGLALIMLSILVLGGNTLLTSSYPFTAHLTSVDGLVLGAKVTLGGVPIGTVDSIDLDPKQRNIVVSFNVEKKSSDWIRKDSTVEVATQGVLGDKYLSLSAGNPDLPAVPSGGDIPVRPTKDLSQFLSKGDHLMISLNSMATSLDRILKNFDTENRSDTFFKGLATTSKNLSLASEKMNQELDQIHLKKAITQLSQIFEKINNGTGTIGALVNDPGLYDQLKALLGGANRNRVIRNLVRQTIKESPAATPEVEDVKIDKGP